MFVYKNLIFQICALTFPFLAAFGMVALSPFLSVRCPFVAVRHHSTVRAGLGRSLSHGFWEPFHFAMYMDEASAEATMCGCKLIPIASRHERQVVFGRIPIPESTWAKEKTHQKKVQYWDLYVQKCLNARSELLHLCWLSIKDVEEMSPNFLTALPAIAIADILCESIR